MVCGVGIPQHTRNLVPNSSGIVVILINALLVVFNLRDRCESNIAQFLVCWYGSCGGIQPHKILLYASVSGARGRLFLPCYLRFKRASWKKSKINIPSSRLSLCTGSFSPDIGIVEEIRLSLLGMKSTINVVVEPRICWCHQHWDGGSF